MKFNMERRQKYLEEILRRQQKQIMKITKELELHREFLNLQFESFMDFLVQNGGQIIQLSGKNGQDETGMFFPMKRGKNGGASGNTNGEGGEDNDNSIEDGAMKSEDQVNGDDKDNHQTLEDDDELDPLPPPQAILGSPSGDGSDEPSDANYQKQNGSHGDDRGQSSRRSSANVVSSSDAQNGDAEYDEVDSSAEYDNNTNPEMMKYDMNHFMFSHFLDGGGGGDDDQDGMDDSYNDDDMAGYEGEDDMGSMVETSRHMGAGRQSAWSSNGNARSSTSTSSHMPKMTGNTAGGNNLPIPPANFPHNERTCRYCGKTFHWKQSWVIHERTHTGEKPYVCKCGKAFSQKSNMNTHAKSCSQATATQKGKTTVFQMKCSHCQKMFTHKKNLDLHMEKFHPEVLNLSTKPLSTSSSPSSSNYQNGSMSTSLLDAEFAAAARAAAENAAILQILKTATASASAQQQVTNNSNSNKARGSMSPDIVHNSNSNSSMSGSDDRNNRFPCPYCPKRFPVKGTLERHLRVHTGEKPFLCGLCGKAFTQKGSVKLHLERVHRQTM